MMKRFVLVLLSVSWFTAMWSVDCNPYFDKPYSNRVANYDIELSLDNEAKKIVARQQVVWINSSPDTISELRFYMYLNSFKNSESTFIKGANGQVFGEDIGAKTADQWGWINVDEIKVRGSSSSIASGTGRGADLTNRQKYIQPNDGNKEDQSVLSVDLIEPLQPGDTIRLDMVFTAKMPEIIARAGYSRDDYYLFVHWFPQMGVYEKLMSGEWGWNCHQFMQNTEFYADFGVYDVAITAPDHLILGASGCLVDEKDNGDGTKTSKFHIEDVIDFAWTAYPYFDIQERQWKHVNIRLLVPQEHKYLGPRYLTAIEQALEYMDSHVGLYPFPQITIVDPPLHGLRSGLMEYPTLVTAGTVFGMPEKVHNMESLAIHEFAHQYFMMMLASNEKEEAWVDEGFVTYYEDRIIDHYYGADGGYYSFWGYQVGNQALSRVEYTGMDNPRVGSIARPGWEFKEGRKELQYAKTATMLRTLERMIGIETMDRLMKTYFAEFRFTHPRGVDFTQTANEFLTKEFGAEYAETMSGIFDQCLYETATCDFEVASITNNKYSSGHGLFGEGPSDLSFQQGKRNDYYDSRVKLYQRGDMIVPVEILVTFDDGSTITEQWDGVGESKYLSYQGERQVVSVHIDPEQKIYLDLDLNNNSKTLEVDTSVLWKYALKAVFWAQNALQSMSWLI